VSDYVDIEAARDVAKVRFVADDRRMVRAELRSNRASVDITFNNEPTSLEVGDVIFVEQEENQIDPAPAGLWVDDRWIGVVRLITDELTVVTDGAGHLRRLLTREDPKVEEGNTAECDDGGVLKVLGARPVRTLDLREEDEIDLSAFARAPAEQHASFEDFGGLHDIVVRARELVEVPLERHEALKVIGARPIKGVLFTGPPGTGKTMLARLIAGQAGAKFYAISGPTIFSKWYGESEAVLRRIFADAAEHQPSIIFFDEIDSVAVRRDQEAHEASKRVVAQLLTLMDGFESNANVIVIAATNRRDAIDEALLRPGRFDWEIEFRMPGADDRLPILERAGNSVATRGVLPLALIAGLTDGWSAAELALVWSEAALLAAVDDREAVVGEDLLGGYERVALRHGRVDREMARS
jgi:transitional endoplasmic reticulum ATPase